ncbi:MAG: hypothetical protein JWN86_4517 [Planctomycetota bacterium]|nr:hypothetical protein [Planctomycetota bacterium]
MDRPSRAWMVLVALGLYLTLRGYHSRDGDQAYRLPLLLHAQDASLFANDPFVRAFDDFNPHRGYLALIDAASRPFGLSVGLAALFAATFVVTCLAVDRLARVVWPDGSGRVGVVAVLLILTAKAGNVGTNHLFEAMLLDRLMALALGWAALAAVIADPGRGRGPAAGWLGLATLVHPSLGLQLALMVGVGWIVWSGFRGQTSVSRRCSVVGLVALGLAMIPGTAMMAGASSRLMAGMSSDDYLTLSATVQSPQHMLPHLWRMPQWLAWACYPILAVLTSLGAERAGQAADAIPESPQARNRLVILLFVNLAGLALAWVAIERLGSVRATVFQPFRMATVARGLCLIVLSNRVRSLWDRGDVWGQSRAALLVTGLTGDWALVVATAVELASTLACRFSRRSEISVGIIVLATGLVFLSRHDTESGQMRLIGALGLALAWSFLGRIMITRTWSRRRALTLFGSAWAVPFAAMIVANVSSGYAAKTLAAHCRFGEWATDDIEALALWCRDHTPISARFVGPPGPKTFRLWSRRQVVFNRAASPYHAAGLADWATKFLNHVGFHGSIQEFAKAYLRDRQGLERRYQEMSDPDRAELARRYGADYVIAAAPANEIRDKDALELLHVEGRYAVYRVQVADENRVAANRSDSAPD